MGNKLTVFHPQINLKKLTEEYKQIPSCQHGTDSIFSELSVRLGSWIMYLLQKVTEKILNDFEDHYIDSWLIYGYDTLFIHKPKHTSISISYPDDK